MCYYRFMYWLRERIHPTWHFTAALLGFVGGVALALVWQIEPWLGYIAGSCLVLLALWRARRMLLLAAIVGGLLIGIARGSASVNSLAEYASLYGQQVTLTGTITDDTDAATQGTRIRLGAIYVQGAALPGQVFATVEDAQGARRSDRITVKGTVNTGFGSFAATITGAATRIERPVPGDVALEIRDTFARQVRSVIDEPQASLGIGYLLGQKSALPAELVDALLITGLTHIVVARGYNLTIRGRASRGRCARVSKYLAMVSSVSLIVGFVAITGLSPSMSRAGLVAGLGIWAWYYGRRFHPLTLLSVAAAVTVAINPSYVWGDLGWLLSFAAFAGVMIVAPVATAYFYGKEKVPFIAQLLVETVSAQITTLPIMIIAFEQFSVIAPLANVLILPLIPPTMLLVALAGIAAWLPIGGEAVGWLAERLLNVQLAVINWCADIPWALQEPKWSWWMALGYCLAITLAVLYMKFRSGYKLYNASLVE